MKDSNWVGDRQGRKGAVERGEGVGKRGREDRTREEEQGRQGTRMGEQDARYENSLPERGGQRRRLAIVTGEHGAKGEAGHWCRKACPLHSPQGPEDAPQSFRIFY